MSNRGFTLTELLITLGIIALLIAILLPVVGKVRQAGLSTMCLSNMRQVGVATLMYAGDNGDYLPFAEVSYTEPGGNDVVLTWDDLIGKHLGEASDAADRQATHLPRRNKLLECPADNIERIKSAKYTSTGDIFPRSYAIVRAFGYDPRYRLRFRGAGGQFNSPWPVAWKSFASSVFRKRSWYENPSTKFLYTERPLADNVLGGYGGYVDATVDNWESFEHFEARGGRTNHGYAWNYLCADGHAESQTTEQAILLPALNKPRATAKAIVVNSNLRQIAVAFTVYETPQQQYLPGIYPISGETPPVNFHKQD